MDSSLLNHFLISLSDRAQSDFAESVLTPRCQDAVIISPDPFPEASKEEEILDQVESAIAQGKPVIYKAGKVKRPERLDWLQKVKARIGYSHQWIAWYLESPEKDLPHPAEGFVKVVEVKTLDASKLQTVEGQVSGLLRGLQQSRTQQQNRYSNYKLHRYSALLDFERLMHLIALIVKYPGIGKLRETEPETVQTILGKHPSEIADDIAEICELMALLKGRVYADPSAIAQDLDWLDHHHFFTTAAVNSRVRVETLNEEEQAQFKQQNLALHPHSHSTPFERLLSLIRYIAQHPFEEGKEREESSRRQQSFFIQMQNDGVLIGDDSLASIREDIGKILKFYELLPNFTMKRGYFFGTGIFSQSELVKIYGLLRSQQVYLDDPVAVEVAKTFRERIESSRLLDIKEIYPSRAIGNRGIVDTKTLPAKALPNQLQTLENAIEEGEKLELALTPRSARFPNQPELDRFYAYPLQVVFHNIAWYLGFERVGDGGEQEGLLCFERMDRLTLENKSGEKRPFAEQLDTLDKLKRLYNASPGIFLGKNVSDQKKYLSKDEKERRSVEMTVELHMTEDIFKFVSEGNQRFLKSQMKMTRPWNQATRNYDQYVFKLPKSKDQSFPYRFRVTLPIWSVDDVDLKRWVLGFGRQVKVVNVTNSEDEPDNEFFKKISEEIAAMSNNYREQ